MLTKFLIDRHFQCDTKFIWSTGFNHTFVKLPSTKNWYARGNNYWGQLCLGTKGLITSYNFDQPLCKLKTKNQSIIQSTDSIKNGWVGFKQIPQRGSVGIRKIVANNM